MPERPKPPVPRPGRAPSRPELPRVAIDHVVESARYQPRQDSPQRRGTLPGGTAAIPAQAPTSLPLPPGVDARDGASESASQGQLAALLEERERLRVELARAKRDQRAQAETRVQSFPPQVTPSPYPRKDSPAPASGSNGDAKVDQALGRSLRLLLARYGWPLAAALGIGAGGAGALRPAADPAKAEATLANTEAIKRELELTRRQLNGLLDREAARDEYLRCLGEQQAEYFAQLTPALDKMGAATRMKPFVDRCKNRKP